MDLLSDNEIMQMILYPAIQKANKTMPNFSLDMISEMTPLYGEADAVLDSLNLVSWIFIVEEEAKAVTGQEIKFTTQDILNRQTPPFANLTALAQFIKNKLQGKA